MSVPWEINAARPAELPAAVELTFAHLPDSIRDARTLNALTLMAAGELDARGVFVARRSGKVRAVFIAQALPGGTGLVWPPRGDAEPFEPLIRAGLDWLCWRGSRVAQVIVPPDDEAAREPLHRAGFQPTGPLVYLRHDLTLLPEPPTLPDFRFATAVDYSETALQEVVRRTYEGTLDFPELTGLRPMPEVLAGHRAAGRYDPRHWRIAHAGDAPAGVTFLTELEPLEAWDLTYLGVVPEFRRRGLARALTLQGLHQVRDAGGAQLEIAVDARNAPALQLYEQLGFLATGRRLVSLYPLPPSGTPSAGEPAAPAPAP